MMIIIWSADFLTNKTKMKTKIYVVNVGGKTRPVHVAEIWGLKQNYVLATSEKPSHAASNIRKVTAHARYLALVRRKKQKWGEPSKEERERAFFNGGTKAYRKIVNL